VQDKRAGVTHIGPCEFEIDVWLRGVYEEFDSSV
jgi:hypothetical protein